MARASNQGGKKRGAGRKPISDAEKLVRSTAPRGLGTLRPESKPPPAPKGRFGNPSASLEESMQEQADTEMVANLDALPVHQQVLIARHVMGDSITKIADEFHHGWTWVKAVIVNNPLAVRQAAAIAGGISPVEVFSEMLPLAQERLKRVLEEGKDGDAIVVATQVNDRVFGKPIVRTQVEVRGDFHVTFTRRSEREAIEGDVAERDG